MVARLKRGKLRLVSDGNDVTKDDSGNERSLHNPVNPDVLRYQGDRYVSYQTLETSRKNRTKRDIDTLPEIISPPILRPVICHPTRVMDKDDAQPGKNLPVLSQPDDIPDEYKFEIYSLRRELVSLRHDKKRLNVKITRALAQLHDELRFWRLFVYENERETLGEIYQRMRQLEAAIKYLDDPSVGEAPDFKIPDRWQKK